MAFKEWPGNVAGFLGKKRKAMGKLKGIGMDEILDRELVGNKTRSHCVGVHWITG